MTFLYFAAATGLARFLAVALKILLGLTLVYFLYKLMCRFAIKYGYSKITRITVYGKKDLIKRYAVPTGYSEGYYRTEHYKYVNKREGRKYKIRVYFGKRFYIIYSFRGSDKLLHRLLEDGGLTVDKVNAKLAQE